MNVGIGENSILHHVLNRPYQHILYFQNVIGFQGTYVKVISFTHTKKNMAFPGTSFKETHKYSEAFSANLICQIHYKIMLILHPFS
jgi:hypothetical protein